MNSEPTSPPGFDQVVLKVTAWVFWSGFMLISIGQFAYVRGEMSDGQLNRYYSPHTMSQLTVLMTSYPVWISMLPLPWLPFIVAYQDQPKPKGILLLPLIVTMFITIVTIAIWIYYSGPWIGFRLFTI